MHLFIPALAVFAYSYCSSYHALMSTANPALPFTSNIEAHIVATATALSTASVFAQTHSLSSPRHKTSFQATPRWLGTKAISLRPMFALAVRPKYELAVRHLQQLPTYAPINFEAFFAKSTESNDEGTRYLATPVLASLFTLALAARLHAEQRRSLKSSNEPSPSIDKVCQQDEAWEADVPQACDSALDEAGVDISMKDTLKDKAWEADAVPAIMVDKPFVQSKEPDDGENHYSVTPAIRIPTVLVLATLLREQKLDLDSSDESLLSDNDKGSRHCEGPNFDVAPITDELSSETWAELGSRMTDTQTPSLSTTLVAEIEPLPPVTVADFSLVPGSGNERTPYGTPVMLPSDDGFTTVVRKRKPQNPRSPPPPHPSHTDKGSQKRADGVVFLRGPKRPRPSPSRRTGSSNSDHPVVQIGVKEDTKSKAKVNTPLVKLDSLKNLRTPASQTSCLKAPKVAAKEQKAISVSVPPLIANSLWARSYSVVASS